MKILISNDDGINAPGIIALATEMSKYHDVTVVAPSSERSACSHSLSSMYSVNYKRETSFKYKAYSCSGTPADCVKLGVLHLTDCKFDLVLSGINRGTNLGSDVIYSGTVAAAYEGVYMGLKSIAISTSANATTEQLEQTAQYIRANLDKLLALKLPKTSALNINYPQNKELKGSKIAPLGIHLYGDGFFKVEGGYQLQGVPLPLSEDSKDCDIHWYNEGFVTITPIQNDRNDYLTLKKIKDITL